MRSQHIKIAVANILSTHNNGIERCCGSCNPSCDDLTRFICCGHTMEEVEIWIDQNYDILCAQLEEEEEKMYKDYCLYASKQQEEEKLAYAKTFCLQCPKYLSSKQKALDGNNSVFDAVLDVEAFQRDCIKSCVKFNEAFILNGREKIADEEDFSI